MRSLSDLISRLKTARGQPSLRPPVPSRLTALGGIGANPGDLAAFCYVPEGLPAGAPLVVALHGCTQTAADYDHGTGWSRLADLERFAVLFPEQQRSNNPNLCFNWFVPGDVARESGEALSIARMIRTMTSLHGLDRDRVFVTGLSAGGAMAAAMLATYPELFASGAIIAGLPFGSAASVPEAFDRMRGHGLPSRRDLESKVRQASSHPGPWPTLSLWHGTADMTVAPANTDALVAQWSRLHGVEQIDPAQTPLGPHTRRVWHDAEGSPRIEAFSIAGMGHGAPLDGAGGLGSAGPFMLDAGISSTLHIARFWQLTTAETVQSSSASSESLTPSLSPGVPWADRSAPSWTPPPATGGVGKVIEDALRAAGLMR
jgi:poly(hydroxyalkanoate) depolymerase family esterase